MKEKGGVDLAAAFHKQADYVSRAEFLQEPIERKELGIMFQRWRGQHLDAPGQRRDFCFRGMTANNDGCERRVVVADDLRSQGRSGTGIQDDSSKLFGMTGFGWAISDCQAWIVGKNGVDADEEGVIALPQFHSAGAGLRARDPFGFAGGSGDFAIERHGRFHRDEGCAVNDPMVEGFVESGTFLFENTGSDGDTGAFEDGESIAGMRRIGIGGADDDALDSCRDYRIRARRRAANPRSDANRVR